MRRLPASVWIGAASAVAFALRISALDRQSLWYDEAVSVLYAQQPLSEMLRLAAGDNHPPLSYLLLSGWLAVAGTSDFAIRYLHVLVAVLAIPLVFALARQILSARFQAGSIIAAWLLTVSPWHVWYSQEARMYGSEMTLAILASLLFLNAWERRTLSAWVRYTAAGTALLYTHYYGALVLLGHAVFALGGWLSGTMQSRHWRLPDWLVGQAAIAALFLPWAGALTSRVVDDATSWSGTIDWRVFGEQIASSLAVGRTLPAAEALTPTMAALALATIGAVAVAIRRDGPRSRSLYLLAGVAVPVATLSGLVAGRPKFDPRYLLPVLPLFEILAAAGLVFLAATARQAHRASLGRHRAVASAAIGLGARTAAVLVLAMASFLLGLWQTGTLSSLTHLYGDPSIGREDFRGVMRFIQAQAKPDDAIVVVSGHAAVPLLHYRTHPIDVYPMPAWIVTDLRHPLRTDEVARQLNEIVAHHQRIWLVRWQVELADPSDNVLYQIWSNGHEDSLDVVFQGLDVRLFTLEPGVHFADAPRPQHVRQETFGHLIELRGVDVDRTIVKAGGVIAVTLYWRAPEPVHGDPITFLHLLNDANRVYAQIDRRPGGDFNAPARWSPGEIVRDPYYLTVPPGTPPGHYRLEAGLYWPITFQRLTRDNGEDHAILLSVDVVRDPLSETAPAVQHPESLDFGPIRLLGYELERTDYAPGEELRVRFWWRALEQPADDLRLEVKLVGENGVPLVVEMTPPVDGLYPTSRWSAGELVRDLVPLTLPPQAPPGRYVLHLSVRDSQGRRLGDWDDPTLPITIR